LRLIVVFPLGEAQLRVRNPTSALAEDALADEVVERCAGSSSRGSEVRGLLLYSGNFVFDRRGFGELRLRKPST
jgi:hypothetical protein